MKKTLIIFLIITLWFISYIVGYNTATTTTNLSLVKPASGDTVYDWFDTTNSNMDLIDAIFNTVSLTEFGYLDGVTSNIQTQLNAKATGDFSLYYLKTQIDTLPECETIWTLDVTTSTELATALTSYYLKTDIDTSAEIAAIVSDETGTGVIVFGTSPTFTTNLTVTDLIYFDNTVDYNIKLGYQAGKNVASGAIDNTFVGYQAGYFGATSTNAADCNIAVGYKSLYSNTTGSENLAIGVNALYSNTTGYENLALGYGALYSNTIGIENIAIGYKALYTNVSGNDNFAMGVEVLRCNTTGYENTSIGTYSLWTNTEGYDNSALGYNALYANSTGYQNTAVGTYAGDKITTGNSNTFVGYAAGDNASQKVDAVNSTALGANAYTTASNQMVYGDANITQHYFPGGNFILGTAGVSLTPDGDGALTILGLGDGTDESLLINFDDTSNEVDITSGSGVLDIDFNTIDLNTDTLDLSGTGTINGLDAVDATGEATLEAALDIAGDIASTGMASTDLNESILLVGGSDTIFPADPGADKFLMWDDDPGALAWASAPTPAEDDIEALIFDADAESILGVWEVADDVDLVFGTDANWLIQYDEAVDDQLLFITAGTGCTATTDPMFEIIVGATPTANQEVFGVSKGTQASNTALFTLDEDGDMVIPGTFDAGSYLDKLSAFAATTSAELAGVISDETGTDKLVYNTSPSLVTPTLGAASATSINLTGGQIAFPATAAPSADANTLDDYEEGTWTMGVSFGGGTTGITYNRYTGYYTKIGNLVTISGRLTLTSKGSSTGAALLTGLPFTVVNNDAGWAAAVLRVWNITFANQIMGNTVINTTTIELQELTEAGASTPLADTDFANTSEIIVGCTYRIN